MAIAALLLDYAHSGFARPIICDVAVGGAFQRLRLIRIYISLSASNASTLLAVPASNLLHAPLDFVAKHSGRASQPDREFAR
jgi:hypothetical protein